LSTWTSTRLARLLGSRLTRRRTIRSPPFSDTTRSSRNWTRNILYIYIKVCRRNARKYHGGLKLTGQGCPSKTIPSLHIYRAIIKRNRISEVTPQFLEKSKTTRQGRLSKKWIQQKKYKKYPHKKKQLTAGGGLLALYLRTASGTMLTIFSIF